MLPPAVMGNMNDNAGSPDSDMAAAQTNGANNFPSPSSTVSGRGADPRPALNGIIPISQSSELAFALQHSKDDLDANQQGPVYDRIVDFAPADAKGSRSDSDSSSFSNSHRSSCSSGSSLMYPLSASSSKSSLARQPHLALDISHPVTDKFVADEMDFISMSGHYSPVSHPNSAAFDFPPSRPMSMTLGGGHMTDHMHSMMSQQVAPSANMYSSNHFGDAEFGKPLDRKEYIIGPQDPMNSGLQINLGDDLINHSAPVGTYNGYYN